MNTMKSKLAHLPVPENNIEVSVTVGTPQGFQTFRLRREEYEVDTSTGVVTFREGTLEKLKQVSENPKHSSTKQWNAMEDTEKLREVVQEIFDKNGPTKTVTSVEQYYDGYFQANTSDGGVEYIFYTEIISLLLDKLYKDESNSNRE